MLTLGLFLTAPFSSLSIIFCLGVALASQIFQNYGFSKMSSQNGLHVYRSEHQPTLRLSSAAPVTTVHPSGLTPLPKIRLSCAAVTSCTLLNEG
jgi:hypothetical protein